MKITTAAIGEYYVKRLNDLAESIPVSLDHILLEGDFDLGYRGFNYSACKRIAMKLADSDVLFINVDMICHDKQVFADAVESMKSLPVGIYSVHTFGSYGMNRAVPTPIIPDQLNWKFRFLADKLKLSDDYMHVQFPLEVIMLFKFDNAEQRNAFFDMWYEAEKLVQADKRFTMIEECFSIGIAAHKYGLPVKRFPFKLGLTHSHLQPDGTLRTDKI